MCRWDRVSLINPHLQAHGCHVRVSDAAAWEGNFLMRIQDANILRVPVAELRQGCHSLRQQVQHGEHCWLPTGSIPWTDAAVHHGGPSKEGTCHVACVSTGDRANIGRGALLDRFEDLPGTRML